LQRPFHATAADIDGDRDADLLVTHDDAEEMSLLLNDGKGGFTASPASPFPLGGPAWHAVSADFNADGRMEFATAGAGHVRVFLADDKGRFTPAAGSPYPAAGGSWQLALADLNGDGKQDLITCGVEERRITLLLHR
jgi:hypothetical protein